MTSFRERLSRVIPPTRTAATAVLVLVALPFVIYAIPQLVGATGSYVVVSNSMAPKLHAGDVVFVYETDPQAIEEGDVITYYSPDGGMVTTHQVVGVTEQGDQRYFKTKGIANEEADPTRLPATAVIGKVRFHLPWLGHVTTFISSRVGIVLFVIVPAGLLVVLELLDVVKAVNREDETETGAHDRPVEDN